MASFDPREWIKKEDPPAHAEKLPIARLEPTLRKFIQVALPTDLERLRRHQINIEKYVFAKRWKELNIEQINASRTVQYLVMKPYLATLNPASIIKFAAMASRSIIDEQLKANMRELDKTRHQIKVEDLPAFEKKIAPIKREATDAISSFGDLQAILKERRTDDNCQDKDVIIGAASSEIHTQSQTVSKADEAAASASWDELRESLVDLNCIIHQFSDIVIQQQEKVDSISENIEKSHSNVREAVWQLGQASKLKAAMVPLAGAVVGGLIGGPIGLIAGFKVAGVAVATVGGGVVGFQGGKMLKNKRNEKVEMELEKLSDRSVALKSLKDETA